MLQSSLIPVPPLRPSPILVLLRPDLLRAPTKHGPTVRLQVRVLMIVRVGIAVMVVLQYRWLSTPVPPQPLPEETTVLLQSEPLRVLTKLGPTVQLQETVPIFVRMDIAERIVQHHQPVPLGRILLGSVNRTIHKLLL